MFAWVMSTSWGRGIATALGLLAALWLALRAAEYRGARNADARRAIEIARANARAHERMNHAPDLRDATDHDRVDWLRDYANRNTRP